MEGNILKDTHRNTSIFGVHGTDLLIPGPVNMMKYELNWRNFVTPDDELSALWYHLEPLCKTVPAPDCSVCSGPMDLVPPEELYYVCKKCFPESFSFKWLPYGS